MPIKRLVPSLLRVAKSNTDNVPNTPSLKQPSNSIHPLATSLASLLLTPRASSHKYNTRIAELIDAEEPSQDSEENMMWYAMRHEKADITEHDNIHDHEADEEKWKHKWLERMERRELRNPPKEVAEPVPFRTSKRSKREAAEPSMLSFDAVEAQLETYMDKLSMWQLTNALNKVVHGHDATPKLSTKGKERQSDERDWMQIFCEDIVEPQFKSSRPVECALLRTKVFPSSPFSDDSDPNERHSPPGLTIKQRHTQTAASSRQQSPHLQSDHTGSDRQLARSASLSLTLEQERERSRSVGIGPGNTRKRALVREVSMTTAFKGKTKPRPKETQEKKSKIASATESAPSQKPAGKAHKSNKSQGRTLVAATPVKSRRLPQSFNQSEVPRDLPPNKIPRLSVDDLEAGPVEGDSDDEEWMFPASPDIVLLGSRKAASGVAAEGKSNLKWTDSGASGNIWVTATPTKAHRSGA